MIVRTHCHTPTYTLTHLHTHSLTLSHTHSITHPLTHSLTLSLTHPLNHTPTHSLTHSVSLSGALFTIEEPRYVANETDPRIEVCVVTMSMFERILEVRLTTGSGTATCEYSTSTAGCWTVSH